jgi:hypothetical protein
MRADGLCECGCGNPAPIAKATTRSRGWIKGKPMRFILGHVANVQTHEPVADRFWRRVEKGDGCWLWTGRVGNGGYGLLDRISRGRSRPVLAHRMSWELTHGSVPNPPQELCHTCDNRLCVRPDHMWIGTRTDNMIDCATKGRTNKAKLTAMQVAEIRRARRDGVSAKALADRYRVTAATVYMATRGITWAWLPDNPGED